MDKWSTTVVNASTPSARTDATAVWTGTEMIVWGGRGTTTPSADGGRYDPGGNSWTAIGPAALAARYLHTAVWDGSRMILYGGVGGSTTFADGDRFRPSDNAWTSLPLGEAPEAGSGETRVWTGNELIVWGGTASGPQGVVPFDSGSRYDPMLDHWTRTSEVNAPLPRFRHSAIWTGSRMIVWGGTASGMTNTGGLYDPLADSWSPITAMNAPAARGDHTAVWTGSRMVVWGGTGAGNTRLNTGGSYDPAADTWQPTSTLNAPSARYRHAALWTGEKMIVWGGWTGTQTNTGGQYDPASETWELTSLSGAPDPRENPSAIWTGAEVIVWGGDIDPGPAGQSLNTGARYDPFANTWAPIASAPIPKTDHSAVWTGSEMMVWGQGTGERLDLDANTWSLTSTEGAPAGTTAATWTGDLVLVWGSAPRTGSRYAIDTDHDGLPNACDPDDDGDGVADQDDCAPTQAGVAAPPQEVADLHVVGTPVSVLTWTSQLDARYDVVGGSIATLRSTGGLDGATCVANSVTVSEWQDYPVPAPGEGFFYLVRAQNSCGSSTYGHTSSGTPRTVASDCL